MLNELRRSGFCDIFEYGGAGMNLWCCFLCNHPERAIGFLQDSQPVIEGQLKEKKGRWKLFKRWKTRYFTLSGAHLSYKESVSGLPDSLIIITDHFEDTDNLVD